MPFASASRACAPPTLAVLFALSAVAACSGATTSSTSGAAPDAASTEPETDADVVANDAGASRDAARDAGNRPKSDSGTSTTEPPACVQGGTCTGDQRCAENDGTTYHHCSCSADALACGDMQVTPPTTCVAGGACTGTSTCGVDDGVGVEYCHCVSGHYECSSQSAADSNCTIQTVPCMTPPPGGVTEWLGCFRRDPGNVVGFVCHLTPGGYGANGTTFTPACPSKPPTTGTACGSFSSSTPCGCEDPIDGPCVCLCTGTWSCLH